MNRTKTASDVRAARDLVREPKMKTLIIDDDAVNVALLEAMLLDNGYTHIKSITDPRLALEICNTFKPDLILLDWLMPHLDGSAILRSLRASSSEVYLPVVVLTADTTNETKHYALHIGATDFLLKPFDQVEVLLRIRNLLEAVRTDRTRATHYTVASSLAASSDLLHTSSKILEAIASSGEWSFGAMWLHDKAAGSLRCLTTWHPNCQNGEKFDILLRSTKLRKEQGLPGRAWASKKPIWVADITGDPNFPHAGAAAQLGLRGGLAFPLRLEEAVNGVIELFSNGEVAQPDEDLLQMIEALGIQIGLFIERRRMEQELQRQKESAEAANAAKDRFLAMLSHELRTPLTPVLMWASGTVQQPDLRRDLQEGLKMVCRNVELEARLIDDMLDLTRITRGKLKLELKAANVHEILQHAIEIVRSDIQARHISLSVALEASNRQLLADPARMQQVFWNLLRNACKFTPEKGAISIRSYNPTPEMITVEIRDSGIGIEPQHLKKIFDAFEQVDSRQEGLGLGLAIAKAIIELHGGTIHVCSEDLGRGATFAINLRVPRVDNLNEGIKLSGGVGAEWAPEFSGAELFLITTTPDQ